MLDNSGEYAAAAGTAFGTAVLLAFSVYFNLSPVPLIGSLLLYGFVCAYWAKKLERD